MNSFVKEWWRRRTTRTYSLVSDVRDYSFQIPEGITKIGRGATMREYLQDQHIAIIQVFLDNTDGRLRMWNTGLNPCFVNGEELRYGQEATLRAGDSLTIVNVPFHVVENK